MSITDQINAAEPKRDGYGRYMIVPAKGGKAVAHTRATTVAETLDDRYNLELWKMRQVALGLAVRHDLLAQVVAHTADDKKVLNAVCKDAMDAAAAQSGANMGTALHRIVERHNLGTLDECPDMFTDRLAAYVEAMAPLTIRRDLVERVAVLGTHKIAGMFDLGVEIDGRLYVADLKTGSGIDFGARGFAVQLAIYANAVTLYDYATDTHTPAPDFDKDRALIVHLPSGGGPCELHWLDIAAGREALDHAMWVRKWRSNRKLLVAFETSPSKAATPSPGVTHNFRTPETVEYVGPNEGDTIADLDEAKARIKAAMQERGLDPGEGTRTLNRWVTEGSSSGRPWRITELASTRRYTLYRGAVRLIDFAKSSDGIDDDAARSVLSLVLKEEIQPTMRVGMAIGAMTAAEGRRLIETCDALNSGAKALTFDDAGHAVLAAA